MNSINTHTKLLAHFFIPSAFLFLSTIFWQKIFSCRKKAVWRPNESIVVDRENHEVGELLSVVVVLLYVGSYNKWRSFQVYARTHRSLITHKIFGHQKMWNKMELNSIHICFSWHSAKVESSVFWIKTSGWTATSTWLRIVNIKGMDVLFYLVPFFVKWKRNYGHISTLLT